MTKTKKSGVNNSWKKKALNRTDDARCLFGVKFDYGEVIAGDERPVPGLQGKVVMRTGGTLEEQESDCSLAKVKRYSTPASSLPK